MTALRLKVPPQAQDRARNAAQMMSRVSTALTGFTTMDAAVSAEVAAKRSLDEIRAVLVDIRQIKAEGVRQAKQQAKDRAVIEMSQREVV